jgi:hypothetical protein
MIYLRFTEGVVTYPYSLFQLRQAHPQVSFPAEMGADLLLEYDVFVVTETERPAPSDPLTKDVVEAEPIPVNGTWTQQWVEVGAPDAQDRQNYAADEAQRVVLKADSWVASYIAMSDAELDTYLNNQIAGTTAQQIAALKTQFIRLAKVVKHLARRELR